MFAVVVPVEHARPVVVLKVAPETQPGTVDVVVLVAVDTGAVTGVLTVFGGAAVVTLAFISAVSLLFFVSPFFWRLHFYALLRRNNYCLRIKHLSVYIQF